MFVDGSKFRCCHGKQVDCGPGGLCFIAILPFIHRLWKIPVHLLWGLWDSTVFPILKMLAIFWWPRSSIRWPFWRLVFCAIWLDKIEQHLHENRDAAGDLYPTCCRNATQDQSNEMAACRDPARANNYVRGRPLEAAAQEFRDRISGELNMFSVVSVLLATMTFTAFVTSPDVMVMRERSVTNATNNTQGQDTILQCYNGTGWDSECVWLNGFLVCDFMSLTLSLIITGMYVRFSTVLRYCPTGKYVIWFIHRMEPAFALMHIFFMLSIHLAILSAGFYGWGVWKRITGPPLVIGLTAAAGVCLLYFEYSYANSMFCRDHGLCGVIGRILDHPTNVPDSPSIMYLIREFRLVLTEQPFNLYTHQVVGGEDRFTVKSDLDDCPCKDVDLTNIWFEDNIQVTLGCCGDHVILEPVVPGAAAPGGGAVAAPVVPGAAAPGGGAVLVAAPVVPGAPALGAGAMNGGGAVAAPVVPGAPALGGGAVNGGHPVGHCTVQ